MRHDTAAESTTGHSRKGGLVKIGLIAVGIVALGLAAGCGKKDDPKPPGPNPTYPKTYPTS